MSKKIKVYGVPGCPFCKKTREFLRNKGLNFEDIDVAADHDLAKEMIKKSGQMSVPIIEIDGKKNGIIEVLLISLLNLDLYFPI